MTVFTHVKRHRFSNTARLPLLGGMDGSRVKHGEFRVSEDAFCAHSEQVRALSNSRALKLSSTVGTSLAIS